MRDARIRHTTALFTLSVTWFACAPPSGADPYSSPPEQQASCDFALSYPQSVQLPGGAPAVTATMAPKTCTGSITLNQIAVCVAKTGGPSKCNSVALNQAVQVYLPTSATGSFTSTGKMCGITLTPIQTVCVTAGPYTSTL